MITRFGQITKDGLRAYMNLKTYTLEELEGLNENYYRKIYEGWQDIDFVYEVINSSGSGIFWECDGEQHILLDDHCSISGYPSVDREYVITIYNNDSHNFIEPHNAVVYKASGELHKVLTMPKLESEVMLTEIRHNKASNPPIDPMVYGGVAFFELGNYDTLLLEEGADSRNTIYIAYGRFWVEKRILYPNTGKVGELIESLRR